MSTNATHARSSPLRRNLRGCTYDGLTAMPAVFLLTPGNFVIAALLTTQLQLPPATYGVIVSMPFWFNFLQLAVTPLLDDRMRPQRLAALSAAAQCVLLGALAVALFWIPTDRPDISAPWLVLLFGLLGATAAFAGVGWTSWIQEWVPDRLRGKYFGLRNQVLQSATAVFLVSSGLLLRHYGSSVLAFQMLLFTAVALRIVSAVLQFRMVTPVLDAATASTPPRSYERQRVAPRESTHPHLHEAKRPWREQLDTLRSIPSFLWFIAFSALWGFAANCIGPFYAVFMYDQLGLTVDAVMWLTVLTSVGGVLSYPAWGRLAHRFGNKPVIFFAMITWQVQNFLWCFLTPANTWLLYAMWIFGGVMSAGVLLGMFNILLKLIPSSAKTAAISLNIAISSLVTAVAPMLGGLALERLLGAGYDPMTIYHRLFLLQPVLAIGACLFLLSRVHEPRAGELTTVFGAMRNVRTLGSIFGLTYLVNFVFIKNQKR